MTNYKLSIALISLCFSNALLAGQCVQTFGSSNCVSPEPPRITGPWRYTSVTNETPPEGRETLDEAVQDFFQYEEKANNWNLSSVSLM